MKTSKSLLKLILGFVIPWVVFVDLAIASCTPNTSPTSNCAGLFLDEDSETLISIPSGVTVSPFVAPEWAVDIDFNATNINLTNAGIINGLDRGISIRSTATNITITNTVDGRIMTSSGPSIFNEGGINTLINNGLVDSPYSGITNQGEINTLSNNYLIFGQSNAIGNEGRIDSISNNSSLRSGHFGISNSMGAYIGSILNASSIEVDTAVGSGTMVSSGIFNYQSEIRSITNDSDSTILITDSDGSSIVNSGIANTNSVEGPTGRDSSIGDIVNTGYITAIGENIVAGIFNGYLVKFSRDPSPTTASATNSIQSITNHGSLYAEGVGLFSAGVLNGGYAPLSVPGDRDESYNHIARIENFFRIEGKTSTPMGSFGAGIFNGAIDFSGGGISNRDGYVIDELVNNSGSTITGSSTDTLGVGILNAGVFRAIRNAGLIDSSTTVGSALGIYNIGIIETLGNQAAGTIENGIYNVEISTGLDPANIRNLINSGVIQNTGSIFDPDVRPMLGTVSSFAIHNFGGAIINDLTNTETGRIINGIGNSTNSTINYLTNFGEIQAGSNSFGIITLGSIGELNNSGSISVGNFGYGIFNDGFITTLNNSDMISSGDDGYGIYNFGYINNLTNFSRIFVGNNADGINNEGGEITTLINAGTITVGNDGYGISSTDDSLITTLSNSGSIAVGDNSKGIFNSANSSIATMSNLGTITAGAGGWGIGNFNLGNITAFTNSGTITVGAGGFGITNYGSVGLGGIITTLDNLGTISAGDGGVGIASGGVITTLNNLGTISVGDEGYGIGNGGTITILTNLGTISSGDDGKGIYNGGLINTLTNTGSINGDIWVTCDGLGSCNSIDRSSGRINTLNNLGAINGDVVLWMDAPTLGALPSIGTLNNSGSLNRIYLQYLTGEGVAIETVNNSGHIRDGVAIAGVLSEASAGIGTLLNSGTIDGGIEISGIISTSGRSGAGIRSFINTGTVTGGIDIQHVQDPGVPQSGIELLTNTGSIIGGITVSDIFGASTGIITLNNSQGGASSSVLVYSGTLPNNYNIIINSATRYGQLEVSAALGTMAFSVMEDSSLPTGIYTSVLRGVSAGNISAGLSGIHSDYFYWSLSTSATEVWDMSVYFDISSNTTGLVSIENLTGSGPAILGTQSLLLTAASGTYSGLISGSGGITINGGEWILTGANTYSGDTTVSSGILSLSGDSPTGTGLVTVASGAMLMGRGTITGSVNVSGALKPGNSPGFLSTTSTVTMNAGSSYLQDIAGTVQASSSSPVGATGYYSFLNVTNGQFVIQPGATLTPRLSNLFTTDQSGYGSAIFVPRLGDRFRIVTANGGITGKFSNVTQPSELAPGTQFLPFYNMAGSNSIDLAVIPTSYQSTIAAASGNANAQSLGDALTQIAQASLSGTATAAQDQLLYAISGQNSAQGIANLAQGMSGEVYAATVAVMAQTTQRTQQTVLRRLGDTTGLGLNVPMASGNAASNSGGAPSAKGNVFSNGNIWGDLAYQRGDRSSDSYSGGWSSNLFQLTFGSDFYYSNGTTVGGGFALSSTTLNPIYGSSTIQQGSLFAYGKMPVKSFVLDAMISIGLSSSNIKRGDVTGLSAGFENNSVLGNDGLLSLGLSRPIDMQSVRITPYTRFTWQMVTQSSINEGDAASALSVNGYTGNGLRGVIGIAAGSKADNPMASKFTYRAYVGVGVDSSGLLNPTLTASLAGMNTNITTPNAGATFVQVGLYGTAKMSQNTFGYVGISGEVRSGQTLGTINLGLKLQF